VARRSICSRAVPKTSVVYVTDGPGGHPAQEAHPDRDAAARRRADRLAKATTDQMQAALAFLSMIDSEAFEIAFTAVASDASDGPEDEEPIPLWATCRALLPAPITSW
jgi:hypothetical protein